MTARKFERVCSIIEQFESNPQRLIPILQAAQEAYRYLPEEVLTYIAGALNLSPAHVYGVATFYSHFALEPKGKYTIKFCDGTACHVKKSGEIIKACQERLHLTNERHTSEDMLFTLETVSCLGACGIAPVMVVNEKVYGEMTPARAVELINSIMEEETKNEK